MSAPDRLNRLASAAEAELVHDILPYWYQTLDRRNGGYFGLVRNDNSVDPDSPKGVVMHSRHLWAYSQAWTLRRRPLDLQAARQAQAFLTGALQDQECGGFWWTVDSRGRPERETKVIYGQAFAVYGLSQYFRATGDQASLDLALETFARLEGVARDRESGGYYEAVDRAWSRPLIQALSEVDVPCSKSMNTNLHVLEAYTALLLATGSAAVRDALSSLVDVFHRHIFVTPEHLGLYFDRDWRCLTDHVSYGHDIEASWLLAEAAETLGERGAQHREACVTIARGALAMLDADGALPNETHQGHLDTDRVWWVQAEALVGFVNAWQLSGDEAFLSAAERLWAYVEAKQIDREHGEWFWLVDKSGRPDPDRPKGGLWKTSYHNGRACMELMLRALASSESHSVLGTGYRQPLELAKARPPHG